MSTTGPQPEHDDGEQLDILDRVYVNTIKISTGFIEHGENALVLYVLWGFCRIEGFCRR